MIIDCIGCLHGARPKLEGGDLLIVTGDLTRRDEPNEYAEFVIWLQAQKYSKKIVIAGNHDNFIYQYANWADIADLGFIYLCDSGAEFQGLKIWGSPWTSRFDGINPNTCAFTRANDEEITPRFQMIPDDVDILITHSPPFTIRDKITNGYQVGSPSLMAMHICRLRPKLWAFSHIHEGYGEEGPYVWNDTRYVNCSIMNEHYQPVNAPIRIVL